MQKVDNFDICIGAKKVGFLTQDVNAQLFVNNDRKFCFLQIVNIEFLKRGIALLIYSILNAKNNDNISFFLIPKFLNCEKIYYYQFEGYYCDVLSLSSF